jgi:Polyketide cyclase / dehydrase and lipid transport
MVPSPIVAMGVVPAPPATVFRYLDDLANHVRLAPRSTQVLMLERRPGGLDRAVVRLKGPLGMRRTTSTELVRAEAPGLIAGRARLGLRTSALVTGRISGAPAGSVVALSAAIEAAGPLDTLVLRLGGRRWIARRFAAALKSLGVQLQIATSTRPDLRRPPAGAGPPAPEPL